MSIPIPPSGPEQKAVCCDELRSLRDCVRSGFSRLEEQINRTNERVSELSYHIIDPKRPQDTLPARVNRLEGLAKIIKGAVVAFVAGILTTIAAIVVNRVVHGG